MDGSHVKSSAGIRQFEQTAIAKLQAEGVPYHVAHAFVHQGIPKSGRQDALKDVVCKMRYEKFFVERSDADFKDPSKVGALVPTVHESNLRKFHTQFAMSDIDAARFGTAFPEFDVVARGREHNSHAFYANKRYAETELLVSMVFRHSNRYHLDPISLIDLGGNESVHAKRQRPYVHCDNPILSARDVMRYKARSIFSQSAGDNVCSHKFSECPERRDYAIAVHSTYDVSPKSLAAAMHKKGVKVMYGVLNYIPGIESKASGVYEADGMIMEMVRPPRESPYLKCSFRHDPSLVYKHQLHVLRKYLFVSRRYDFESGSGTLGTYNYKIESVRGNSIVFSISESSFSSSTSVSNAIWSPSSSRLYLISLQFMGLDKMEVDAEYFDRLVLQAAGARNVASYDIVSLFRYAKSLRQRVSINGVVLSSGYTNTPEQLVYSVIAAYGVAISYRAESAAFFKQATSQIVNLRGRGFFKDVFTIAGTAILESLLVLPVLLGRVLRLDVMNDRIKTMVANSAAITVELYKPHSMQGAHYVASLLRRNVSLNIADCYEDVTLNNKLSIHPGSEPTVRYDTTVVVCGKEPVCFRSRGLQAYDDQEKPRSTKQFVKYDNVVRLDDLKGLSEFERKSACFAAMAKRLGYVGQDGQLLILNNGDRLHRIGNTEFDGVRRPMIDDGQFVANSQVYMVFRGYGDKAVVLDHPLIYQKGRCVRFVLFYEGSYPYENYKQKMDSLGVSSDTALESPLAFSPTRRFPGEQVDTLSFEDDVSYDNRRFESMEEGAEFVHSQLDKGIPWMSGALGPAVPTSRPPSPLSEVSDSDSDQREAEPNPFLQSVLAEGDEEAALLERDAGESLSSEAAVSDDLVPGMSAMEELIRSCDEATKVALASTRTVIDLAVAAAAGDVPLATWSSTAQGLPGNCRLVKVDQDGVWSDLVSGGEVSHMAVSDGDFVYDKLSSPPKAGVYVTSDILRVYTGSGIRDSVVRVSKDNYSVAVTCVNGVAGSGKSYTIEHQAKAGDVVLCETRESLKDVAAGLAKVPGWRGHNYTVDSFLLHRHTTSCDTLWIDEAFRLHAGKIHAVIKMLKPSSVYCFGDDKQIPALPFIPGFEFIYSSFSFLSVVRKGVSFRCPADVCFGLSSQRYYSTGMSTHSPILNSLEGPRQYVAGMFHSRDVRIPLFVYTQTCKEELLKSGVKNVMTIGESQGKTFDEVVVYRDNKLAKEIYFSPFQALVAVTRHRKRFTYVTADTVMNDNSAVAELLDYVRRKKSELLLSSHVVSGVKPARDAVALEVRQSEASSVAAVSVQGDLDSLYDGADWADVAAEAEF